MATDDAMDVESASQPLYNMDVEQLSAATPDAPPTDPSAPHLPVPVVRGAPQTPRCAHVAESVHTARRGVHAFLRETNADDIVPVNSRVVIIDGGVRLRLAFRALMQNGVRAAPVVDTATYQFCGMLSVADIVDSLLHLYFLHVGEDSQLNLSDRLNDYTVHAWLQQHQQRQQEQQQHQQQHQHQQQEQQQQQQQQHQQQEQQQQQLQQHQQHQHQHQQHQQHQHQHQQQQRQSPHVEPSSPNSSPSQPQPFHFAQAESSLFDAVRLMRDAHLLHLPILSRDQTLLHTLEHWRVLRFLHRHFASAEATQAANASTSTTRLFSLTMSQLNLGTYSNLVTVSPSTPLLQCLQTIQQHMLSALPVVDSQNQLVEVYSRADTALLAQAVCDLNILQQPIADVLRGVRGGAPFVPATCRTSEMLGTVFERFERMGVQRLYIIGESGLEGVVSLSDLLRYFLHGY